MDEREPNLHLGRSARGGRVKMMKNEIGCMWRGEGGREGGEIRSRGRHLVGFGPLFFQS